MVLAGDGGFAKSRCRMCGELLRMDKYSRYELDRWHKDCGLGYSMVCVQCEPRPPPFRARPVTVNQSIRMAQATSERMAAEKAAAAAAEPEAGIDVGPKMLEMHTEIKFLRDAVTKMEHDRARFHALTAQTDSELSSSALSSKDGRLRAGLGENCPLVWVDAGTRANFSVWALVFSLDLPEVVAMLRTG
jgi:hypothetical protein